jgi:hypothetical protein
MDKSIVNVDGRIAIGDGTARRRAGHRDRRGGCRPRVCLQPAQINSMDRFSLSIVQMTSGLLSIQSHPIAGLFSVNESNYFRI